MPAFRKLLNLQAPTKSLSYNICCCVDPLVVVQADSALALGEGCKCGVGRLQEYCQCDEACEVHLQRPAAAFRAYDN